MKIEPASHSLPNSLDIGTVTLLLTTWLPGCVSLSLLLELIIYSHRYKLYPSGQCVCVWRHGDDVIRRRGVCRCSRWIVSQFESPVGRETTRLEQTTTASTARILQGRPTCIIEWMVHPLVSVSLTQRARTVSNTSALPARNRQLGVCGQAPCWH